MVYTRPNSSGVSSGDLPLVGRRKVDTGAPDHANKRARAASACDMIISVDSEREGEQQLSGASTPSRGKRLDYTAPKFHWSFSHTQNCPITEDRDAMSIVLRHFKHRGCTIPAFSDMTESAVYSDVLDSFGQAVAAFNRYASVCEARFSSPVVHEPNKTVDTLASLLSSAQEKEVKSAAELKRLSGCLALANKRISDLEGLLKQERLARESSVETAVTAATENLMSEHRTQVSQLQSRFDKKEQEGKIEAEVSDVGARLDMIDKMRKGDLDLRSEEARLHDQLSGLEVDLSLLDYSGLIGEDATTEQEPSSFAGVGPEGTNGVNSPRHTL